MFDVWFFNLYMISNEGYKKVPSYKFFRLGIKEYSWMFSRWQKCFSLNIYKYWFSL